MEKSNSQVGQDIFAKYICDTKNGYFLDLGCREPISYNNTYLLESEGWDGLLIDIDEDSINECKKIRKSKSYSIDLTDIKIDNKKYTLEEFLEYNLCPDVIDYISFDVDDDTFDVLKEFPFHKYEFKCMTFEHDVYRIGNKLQKYTRTLFEELGYFLVCANVKHSNNSFEDWFVNPKHINLDRYEHLICNNSDWAKIIEKL